MLTHRFNPLNRSTPACQRADDASAPLPISGIVRLCWYRGGLGYDLQTLS